MAKSRGALRAAFIAAPIAAEAARIIERDGKVVRTYLRKLGKYASKGTGWQHMSAKERGAVFDHYVPAPKVVRAPKKDAPTDAPTVAPSDTE